MESSSTTVATFPRPLNEVIRTNVARPKKSRTKKEKDEEEETLVIDVEIQKCDEYVKFDVYVNDEDDDDVPSKASQMKTEYAGSFVNVPHHKHRHGDDDEGDNHKLTTCLKLGLSDLIEDLGADDDDGVTVTLVPKSGSSDNTVIKNVRIEFAS